MTVALCPECGEKITYRSCQQPNTDAIAELALLVHRKVAHGATEPITVDGIGRAFFESRDAREADVHSLLSITAQFVHDDPDCPACLGSGHVCEDHPDRPWDEGGGCCGAAGMPCPLISSARDSDIGGK